MMAHSLCTLHMMVRLVSIGCEGRCAKFGSIDNWKLWNMHFSHVNREQSNESHNYSLHQRTEKEIRYLNFCQLPIILSIAIWRTLKWFSNETIRLLCHDNNIKTHRTPPSTEEWALSCRLSLFTHLLSIDKQQWVIIAFCWAIESVSLLLPCLLCSSQVKRDGGGIKIVKWRRWQTQQQP